MELCADSGANTQSKEKLLGCYLASSLIKFIWLFFESTSMTLMQPRWKWLYLYPAIWSSSDGRGPSPLRLMPFRSLLKILYCLFIAWHELTRLRIPKFQLLSYLCLVLKRTYHSIRDWVRPGRVDGGGLNFNQWTSIEKWVFKKFNQQDILGIQIIIQMICVLATSLISRYSFYNQWDPIRYTFYHSLLLSALSFLR